MINTPTLPNLDLTSVELEGIDIRDYPDFCDTYVAYACFNDGSTLSEDQLDTLNEDYALINELAHKHAF